MRLRRPIAMGVDLAASEKRPTGLCILSVELEAETWIVWRDSEIVECAERYKPEVIAIDAPLSVPKAGSLRECDRALLKRGIRLLPPTIPSMRRLTLRGIGLKEELAKRGFLVIEVFPGGAQDVLDIPRKKAGRKAVLQGLEGLGIRGVRTDATIDELDAVTAAYVGLLYLTGLAEVVSGRDGSIVMPRKGAYEGNSA